MRAPAIGFDQLVQDFFVRRLIDQRGASARTVESYRDAFELLFAYLEDHCGRPPSALTLADLDAPVILDFLEHLECVRHNSARTRNARLAAIHSFMRYVAVRDPASLPITTRVLAIPAKRFDRPVLGYLTKEQITAILAAPDRTTWSGRRDAILLAVAYNTGARVSELTALRVRDVLLESRSALQLHGKGRKQRVIPLWASTARELRTWLPRDPAGTRVSGLPQSQRDANVAVGSARSARPCRGHGSANLSDAARSTGLTAHASALDGSSPLGGGHGSGRDRALARPLQPGRHAPIPRSRPRHQGGHAQPPERPEPRPSPVPAP